jgi:pimeloyl-ACP methyl ester carboxylesterase
MAPARVKSRTFIGAGLELNCLDYGGEGKQPILFLHGGSAHAHWWDFVAPAFTTGFHALALDQRGHGDSQWADEWAYGSRHYVADLKCVVDGWNLGAPIIVGHSMGGHNALLYAASPGARLRAVVAVDSTPDYPQRAVDFLRGVAERPARRFDSLDEACANFRLLPRESKAAPEVLRHIASHTFRRDTNGKWVHKLDRRTMLREPLDVWQTLPHISCPALIVKVTESPLLDVAVARRMAESMPEGSMVEIADSHHHVMLDNPAALIAALKTFFSTVK